MYDTLTAAERATLRDTLHRAIARTIAHPEILWRYGVLDDCYDALRGLTGA